MDVSYQGHRRGRHERYHLRIKAQLGHITLVTVHAETHECLMVVVNGGVESDTFDDIVLFASKAGVREEPAKNTNDCSVTSIINGENERVQDQCVQFSDDELIRVSMQATKLQSYECLDREPSPFVDGQMQCCPPNVVDLSKRGTMLDQGLNDTNRLTECGSV